MTRQKTTNSKSTSSTEIGPLSDSTEDSKRAANTARYKALARKHGADLSEEGFNEALRKVASPKKSV